MSWSSGPEVKNLGSSDWGTHPEASNGESWPPESKTTSNEGWGAHPETSNGGGWPPESKTTINESWGAHPETSNGGGWPSESETADNKGWGARPETSNGGGEQNSKYEGWGSAPETNSKDPNNVENVAKLFSGVSMDESKEKHNELQETFHEVEIEPIESGNQVETVQSFEQLGLSKEVLKGIYEMGFTRPSKIQQKALPLLLADPPTNMIGQSQSGTGKTAAFVLTMLTRVDFSSETTQALCLAPTRELARQIMSVVKKMGRYTPVTLTEAIREGFDRNQRTNAHLIVGTPGTVTEMIKRRLVDPKNIKIFVLDEADNMLDQQGFGDQSIRIKNMMPKCQIVLFSATYSENVRAFAERFAPRANQFRLKVEELSLDNIRQYYMDCRSSEHKFDVLDDLYSLLTIGQSIIFVQKRETADTIAKRMTENRHTVINLHGGLSAAERDLVMDGYRSGEAKVMISTNVLSRGIDVLQIRLVVNYDIPTDIFGHEPDYETYLHRIGRTGRFGRGGVSIIFVHDEKTWSLVSEIQRYFGKEIKKITTESYDEIAKQLHEINE